MLNLDLHDIKIQGFRIYHYRLQRLCDWEWREEARHQECSFPIKEILEGLDLRLNDEKTQALDARQNSFDFLGFSFSRRTSFKTAGVITLVVPSQKSEKRFREAVRTLTARWTHSKPQQEVVERVNRYVKGWMNYFHIYNCTRGFAGSGFS